MHDRHCSAINAQLTASYIEPSDLMRILVRLKDDPLPDRQALRLLVSRLRAQRLSRNWTQAEMARRAGLSLRAYQDVEGGYGNVTLLNLTRLLGVLGLSDRLAELIPPPEPAQRLEELLAPPKKRASRQRRSTSTGETAS